MKHKILIIDGNSLINRAFYAMPYLTNSKGQFTGAVFGFFNMLIKVLQQEMPTHLIVAFDHSRITFRNQIYPDYKITRKPTPPELKQSLTTLKQALQQMGACIIEQQGIEADDIIGTLAKNLGHEVLILSGDRDVLQLIDDKVSVMFTKKGITETELITNKNIKQLYGLEPSQVIDLKGLMGDASDNIPGIKGVGEKTALKLLHQYFTLENVLDNIDDQKGALKTKLEQGKQLAIISKQLATINTSCDLGQIELEKAKVTFPFNQKVYQIFKQLEFGSILRRQEIFNFQAPEEQLEKQQKLEQTTITTQSQLNQFVKRVQEEKVFAFDLINNIGMAFSSNQNFVVNKEQTLFEPTLTTQQILVELKPIFEDESVLKITDNLKAHLHLLSPHGIKINGQVFDTTLADYLINAGLKSKAQNHLPAQMINASESLKQQLKQNQLEELYKNMELPLVYVLFEMEKSGFKIDDDELNNLSQTLLKQLEELRQQIFALAGNQFNLNSPKQLATVLFDQLNLTVYGNKKNSTNIDILNQLYDKHEIIPLIISYRKLFKLSSSYVESYKEIVKKQGNIIHTVFNQTITSTGRLSSSEPNLQNIPIKDQEGRALRKLFVSKFEDGVIVSADYNQIELRLLAAFSKDSKMVEAYKQGKDIHALTASQIFGVRLEDVTKQMRSEAKAVNFGIVYGISDYGLSVSLGSTKKNARDYIDSYFENYPGVKQYIEANVEIAKQTGMVRTIFNRLRRIPEIKSARYALRQFGERVAMNMPLQGSASDIIKLAMIEVFNRLKQSGLKSQLILQIHDELIIDTVKSEEQQVKQILKQAMTNIVQLEVPLVVDISSGKTWFDC